MGTRSMMPAALAALALLTSGCERTLLALANVGRPPPDATAVYAPSTGLALDIYRPPPGTPLPAPVVVFFHGGGWRRGNREQYGFVGSALARQGAVAVVADYRTFPQAAFPGFVDDAAQAVLWTQAHAARYGGDPARLYLAGHSAGAQIAALLGTDARYLAPGMRPRDLAGVIGLSGPYDFEIGPDYRAVFGPPSQWPRAQAVNFVDGDEPPFLLVHGDADGTVEPADTLLLARRLRANGVPVRVMMLPGGGHAAPLQALHDGAGSPVVVPAIRAFVTGQPPPAP